MTYTVQQMRSDDNDFYWSVYDNESEQIVETFLFKEDANDMQRFFENGGGFAGYTPAFMSRGVMYIPEDPAEVNEKFLSEFFVE